MKNLSAISLLLLLPVLGWAQAPIYRQFFTTNPAPVVDVVAGSNTIVLATTPAVNIRRFMVHSPSTNLYNAGLPIPTNTPSAGQVIVATSAVSSEWATPAGTGSSNITDTGYVAVARNLTVSTNLIVTADTGTNWIAGTNYLGGGSALGNSSITPSNSAIVISDRLQFRNMGAGASPGGTNIFYINPSTGALLWNANNTYDIGSPGNRPNVIYAQVANVGYLSSGGYVLGSTYVGVGNRIGFYGDSVAGTFRLVAKPDGAPSTMYERIYAYGAAKVLVDNSVTGIITLNSRTNGWVGGVMDWSIHSSDAAENQVVTGSTAFAGVNTNGVWSGLTANNVSGDNATSVTSGTLGITWTLAAAASGGTTNVTLSVNADSSLIPSANELYIMWQMRNHGTNLVTAL